MPSRARLTLGVLSVLMCVSAIGYGAYKLASPLFIPNEAMQHLSPLTPVGEGRIRDRATQLLRADGPEVYAVRGDLVEIERDPIALYRKLMRFLPGSPDESLIGRIQLPPSGKLSTILRENRADSERENPEEPGKKWESRRYLPLVYDRAERTLYFRLDGKNHSNTDFLERIVENLDPTASETLSGEMERVRTAARTALIKAIYLRTLFKLDMSRDPIFMELATKAHVGFYFHHHQNFLNAAFLAKDQGLSVFSVPSQYGQGLLALVEQASSALFGAGQFAASHKTVIAIDLAFNIVFLLFILIAAPFGSVPGLLMAGGLFLGNLFLLTGYDLAPGVHFARTLPQLLAMLTLYIRLSALLQPIPDKTSTSSKTRMLAGDCVLFAILALGPVYNGEFGVLTALCALGAGFFWAVWGHGGLPSLRLGVLYLVAPVIGLLIYSYFNVPASHTRFLDYFFGVGFASTNRYFFATWFLAMSLTAIALVYSCVGNIRTQWQRSGHAQALDEALLALLFMLFITNILIYKFIFNPAPHHLSAAMPALGVAFAALFRLVGLDVATAKHHGNSRLKLTPIAYALSLVCSLYVIARIPHTTVGSVVAEARVHELMKETLDTTTAQIFGTTVQTGFPVREFQASLKRIGELIPAGPIPIISRYDMFIAFALQRPILSPFADITTNLNQYDDVLKIIGLYQATKPPVVLIEEALFHPRFDEVVLSLGKEGDLPGLPPLKDLGTSMTVSWQMRARIAFLVDQFMEQMLGDYQLCGQDKLFRYYCRASAAR